MAERREAATADATQSRMAAVRDRPARRARIERIVERLAREAHDGDGEAVERCLSETAERLEDVDVFGDVMSRPVSETIALICRDLGLSPDWPALAQEAWALEELRGGAVGAPLRATRMPTPPVIPAATQRRAGTQQPPHGNPRSRIGAADAACPG